MAHLQQIDHIPVPDIWGRFPIYYAVRYKSCRAVELLLMKGADIHCLNTISGHKVDLLYTALKTRDITLIRCVLKHWGKTYTDIDEYLPLIFDSNIDILSAFIVHFDVKSLKEHESILCKYARIQHYIWLRAHNICFDIQQTLKYTIIYRKTACFSYILTHHVKHVEQVNYIYQTGTRSNFTVLSLCAIHGYLKGLRELQVKGVDYNIITVNNRGETMNNIMALVDNEMYGKESASHKAAIRCCLIYLLTKNPINWQNSRGQTALMMAYRAGNGELAEILINNGADMDIPDMDGHRANNYVK